MSLQKAVPYCSSLSVVGYISFWYELDHMFGLFTCLMQADVKDEEDGANPDDPEAASAICLHLAIFSVNARRSGAMNLLCFSDSYIPATGKVYHKMFKTGKLLESIVGHR